MTFEKEGLNFIPASDQSGQRPIHGRVVSYKGSPWEKYIPLQFLG